MKKLLFCISILAFQVINAQSTGFLKSKIQFDSARTELDTIKIRIMLDQGELPTFTNGYLVRKFISYGSPHPIGKMYEKFSYLDDWYIPLPDSSVWSWKEKNWTLHTNKHAFLIFSDGNLKGL